jgi:hypothetical protein
MDIQTKFSKCKLYAHLPTTRRRILPENYVPDPGYIIILVKILKEGKNNMYNREVEEDES